MKRITATVTLRQEFQLDFAENENPSVEEKREVIKEHACYLMEASPPEPVIEYCSERGIAENGVPYNLPLDEKEIQRLASDEGILKVNFTINLEELACLGCGTLEGLNEFVDENVLGTPLAQDLQYQVMQAIPSKNEVVVQVICDVNSILDKSSVKHLYEDGECPDCGRNIPDDSVPGDECIECGHVFWDYRSDESYG